MFRPSLNFFPLVFLFFFFHLFLLSIISLALNTLSFLSLSSTFCLSDVLLVSPNRPHSLDYSNGLRLWLRQTIHSYLWPPCHLVFRRLSWPVWFYLRTFSTSEISKKSHSMKTKIVLVTLLQRFSICSLQNARLPAKTRSWTRPEEEPLNLGGVPIVQGLVWFSGRDRPCQLLLYKSRTYNHRSLSSNNGMLPKTRLSVRTTTLNRCSSDMESEYKG